MNNALFTPYPLRRFERALEYSLIKFFTPVNIAFVVGFLELLFLHNGSFSFEDALKYSKLGISLSEFTTLIQSRFFKLPEAIDLDPDGDGFILSHIDWFLYSAVLHNIESLFILYRVFLCNTWVDLQTVLNHFRIEVRDINFVHACFDAVGIDCTCLVLSSCKTMIKAIRDPPVLQNPEIGGAHLNEEKDEHDLSNPDVVILRVSVREVPLHVKSTVIDIPDYFRVSIPNDLDDELQDFHIWYDGNDMQHSNWLEPIDHRKKINEHGYLILGSSFLSSCDLDFVFKIRTSSKYKLKIHNHIQSSMYHLFRTYNICFEDEDGGFFFSEFWLFNDESFLLFQVPVPVGGYEWRLVCRSSWEMHDISNRENSITGSSCALIPFGREFMIIGKFLLFVAITLYSLFTILVCR